MADEDTRRYSAAQLERMAARGDYVPSRADAPEIELDEDFWRDAELVLPPGKTIGPSAARQGRAGLRQSRPFRWIPGMTLAGLRSHRRAEPGGHFTYRAPSLTAA